MTNLTDRYQPTTNGSPLPYLYPKPRSFNINEYDEEFHDQINEYLLTHSGGGGAGKPYINLKCWLNKPCANLESITIEWADLISAYVTDRATNQEVQISTQAQWNSMIDTNWEWGTVAMEYINPDNSARESRVGVILNQYNHQINCLLHYDENLIVDRVECRLNDWTKMFSERISWADVIEAVVYRRDGLPEYINDEASWDLWVQLFKGAEVYLYADDVSSNKVCLDGEIVEIIGTDISYRLDRTDGIRAEWNSGRAVDTGVITHVPNNGTRHIARKYYSFEITPQVFPANSDTILAVIAEPALILSATGTKQVIGSIASNLFGDWRTSQAYGSVSGRIFWFQTQGFITIKYSNTSQYDYNMLTAHQCFITLEVLND